MISERTLVRVGVGVIALHVVDDSFVQPQPGTSATDHLVSGLVPLTCWWRRQSRTRGCGPGGAPWWRSCSACSAWGPPPRPGTTPARSAPRATTTPGCSPSPPDVLLAVGVVTLWRIPAPGRADAVALPRRALIGRAVGRRRHASSSRSAPTANAHRPRGRAGGQLGADFEDVSFTTDDGLDLHGWYVPSQNRAAVIAFPGRKGPQGRPGCSCATATACCCSTAAARETARAIRTRSAGTATGTSRPRSTSCTSGPTSIPTGSAGSGCRSAAS